MHQKQLAHHTEIKLASRSSIKHCGSQWPRLLEGTLGRRAFHWAWWHIWTCVQRQATVSVQFNQSSWKEVDMTFLTWATFGLLILFYFLYDLEICMEVNGMQVCWADRKRFSTQFFLFALNSIAKSDYTAASNIRTPAVPPSNTFCHMGGISKTKFLVPGSLKWPSWHTKKTRQNKNVVSACMFDALWNCPPMVATLSKISLRFFC